MIRQISLQSVHVLLSRITMATRASEIMIAPAPSLASPIHSCQMTRPALASPAPRKTIMSRYEECHQPPPVSRRLMRVAPDGISPIKSGDSQSVSASSTKAGFITSCQQGIHIPTLLQKPLISSTQGINTSPTARARLVAQVNRGGQGQVSKPQGQMIPAPEPLTKTRSVYSQGVSPSPIVPTTKYVPKQNNQLAPSISGSLGKSHVGLKMNFIGLSVKQESNDGKNDGKTVETQIGSRLRIRCKAPINQESTSTVSINGLLARELQYQSRQNNNGSARRLKGAMVAVPGEITIEQSLKASEPVFVDAQTEEKLPKICSKLDAEKSDESLQKPNRKPKKTVRFALSDKNAQIKKYFSRDPPAKIVQSELLALCQVIQTPLEQ